MIYKHVVVLGGGFAGPLMAITASDRAERVTLVERYSRMPDEEWLGTPQCHHGHYLTHQGQLLLEKLLPGVLQELRTRGAREIDWAKNASWTLPAGVTRQYDSGVKTLLFSRALLDRIVFERAAALSNVNVMKATVEEVEFADSRAKKIHLSQGRSIADADLVIDARGRTARMREKIEAVVGPIPERSIRNDITYHTVMAEHRFDSSAEILQYYRQPDITNEGIGYFASPIEGDRVTFTVSDYYGGRSVKPFESLRHHPLLMGKELSSPRVFTNLSSVHTRYGKARSWIENYLLVGDAVCRMNPVFAHGMTIALEMVTAFREEITQEKGKVSTQRLQRRFDSSVSEPWLYARMDSIRTRRNPGNVGLRFLQILFRGMFHATAVDARVHLTALKVVHRMEPPTALLSPVFLARVLRSLVFRVLPERMGKSAVPERCSVG